MSTQTTSLSYPSTPQQFAARRPRRVGGDDGSEGWVEGRGGGGGEATKGETEGEKRVRDKGRQGVRSYEGGNRRGEGMIGKGATGGGGGGRSDKEKGLKGDNERAKRVRQKTEKGVGIGV